MISISKRRSKRRWTVVRRVTSRESPMDKTKKTLAQANSSRIKWMMMNMRMKITSSRLQKAVKATSWLLT